MVTRSIHTLREAGYNLVFLICFVTLLSVMLTAVLPSFERHVQREREAELIFRGFQIAEGLRLFQQRFGRYPVSLEEMLEIEPRSLRQLWKDPMTADGRWALILASAPAGGNRRREGEDEEDSDAGSTVAAGSAPGTRFQLPQSSFNTDQAPGPILGVVSRSKESSIRTFMGKDRYAEWRFTATMLPKPAIVPGTTLVARSNVEWLGRAFPPGIEPAAGTGVGGQPADVGNAGGPRDLFDDEEDEEDEEDGG